MKRVSVLLLVIVLASLLLCHWTPANDKSQTTLFDKTIAPLFIERCLDCHGGSRPRGGLDLRSREKALTGGDSGKVLIPGNLKASLLWKNVESGKMPPKKPLSSEEKKILRDWIAAGAKWGSDPIDPFRFTTNKRAGYNWWSLQPVKRPSPPKVHDKSWIKNSIDAFILAQLEAKGLQPSPQADRRILIRRLYFDLIGLPPTPMEVESFVQDKSVNAYEKVVNRLLDSPHYGERWARHWLDVVRFGESNGFEHDELRRNAWPYRDWVIEAFNNGMPYDRFARLQLAGDVLTSDQDGVIATGFLVAGGYDSVGQGQQSVAMKRVVRQDELEDIVGTVSQTFLGLTVNCARCHDHKFDPVRQKEYYQLTAALAGVRHGQRSVLTAKAKEQIAKNRIALQASQKKLQQRLIDLEKPIQKKILSERKTNPTTPIKGPSPIAHWDFTQGTKDLVGMLDVKLHGEAKVGRGGLIVGGNAYASTLPIDRTIKARTLSALVKLDKLQQRGGGVFSIQSLGGKVFDAIVFGERQTGHWMAGSDFFRRTKPFQGTPETSAHKEPVLMTLVYSNDGKITAYRNGRAYGKPYQTSGLVTYAAKKSQLLFGLRHSPPRPGRFLSGAILKAKMFDKALSADEVAAAAGVASNIVSEKEILARLEPKVLEVRKAIVTQLDQIQKQLSKPLPNRKTYAVAPRQPEPTHLLIRGNPSQKGALLKPGGVASIRGIKADFCLPPNAPDSERRRKLAEWITSPKNPLFTRTIVNRLWHYHFGVGIVETPNDFGFNGDRPSHPKLLDWLASELVTPTPIPAERLKVKNFSLKQIHRLIVLSATYRQASKFRLKCSQVDSNNRLLWRKSPSRLEAEAVRDAILSVAGKLDKKMGGPGYRDFQVKIRGATHYYLPINPIDPALYRRTIYRTWARSGRNKMLDTFDCPDPSTTTPKRMVTTTPLQALTLLNSTFVLKMADYFADRVKKEAGEKVKQQIIHAYKLAYGREPQPKEIQVATPIVADHGLKVLCRAIFNSNEFLYID